MAGSKLVDCVCLSVYQRLIPVQLAPRQGFHSPPAGLLAATHTADGGMVGEGKEGVKGVLCGGMGGSEAVAACCDSLGNSYWSGTARRWEILVPPLPPLQA